MGGNRVVFFSKQMSLRETILEGKEAQMWFVGKQDIKFLLKLNAYGKEYFFYEWLYTIIKDIHPMESDDTDDSTDEKSSFVSDIRMMYGKCERKRR